MVDQGLRFIRRKHDGEIICFIANQSAEAVDGWVPLASDGKSAILMDAMTGTTAAQRFGGTARYSTTITRPEGPASQQWRLDLGDVRESARVILNGKPIGTLVAHPFRIELGDALRPGDNLLEIEVTNLAANRIRDLDRKQTPWKIFHDINFVDIQYRPFDASNWPLTPSGLPGPVTLIPMSVANQTDCAGGARNGGASSSG